MITGLSSSVAYQQGWLITGQGIPAGASVTSVTSPASIQISTAATETINGDSLSFPLFVQPKFCFGDDPSVLLPGGKILAGNITGQTTYIYDPAADAWTPTGPKVYREGSDEEGWAKLANGMVLTYDIFQSIRNGIGFAELYDPVANTWSGISPADGTAAGFLPLLSSSAVGEELGPVLRLYDDRILVIGANGQTALYTPATNSWEAGPDILGSLGDPALPFLFAADDAAAAILPNGHVILAADAGNGIRTTAITSAGSQVIGGIPSTAQLQVNWAVTGAGIPTGAKISSIDTSHQVTINVPAFASGTTVALTFGGLFSFPVQLFDFDPTASVITPISASSLPDPRLPQISATPTRMLMLPTGQLLFSDGSTQLWIYTPEGGSNPALQPVILSVTAMGSGVFTLTGTQINGQSGGSAYGDDVQSDENYPIVSFSNASGSVYYARTTNWSYTGVAGGSTPQTVNFTLSPGMPPGNYLMSVSAAGIASDPANVSVSSDLTQVTVTPFISDVLDATSADASLTPGQLAAIYGHHLANSTQIWNAADFTGGLGAAAPLPTRIDGVSVMVGGQAAAVYYISPTQIDFQVPNVPQGSNNVVVGNNGTSSAAFATTVVQSSPSLFYYSYGSDLFASAVHADGSLVGDPAIFGPGVARAHPGETIELFANGIAPSPAGVLVVPALVTAPVSVSAGGYPLVVTATALVSAGQFQINVQLPPNILSGIYPVTLTTATGTSSNSKTVVLLPVGQ